MPDYKIIIAALVIFPFGDLNGQDPRERIYNYPVLQPRHDPKPAIEGWANERVVENLDRGMVAQKCEDGSVYIGWRLLQSDPKETVFNIYRSVEDGKVEKLNKKPLKETTDFVDSKLPIGAEASYWVVPVLDGRKGEASGKVKPGDGTDHASLHSSIRFQGDYSPQRITVADLNGDGTFDFVIKQPARGIDPAGRPDTTGLTYKIEAYLSDGTFLWRNDLGPGIEPGIWYSPMIVYDFNGDGKAEVVAKTGPPDVRDSSGRVESGPEWCSVFDGMTGEEIDRVAWPARNPRFGDYNRNNRQQMGLAYLDGKTPCLLVARGTYKLMIVDAYQMKQEKLEQLWHWDGDEENPVIRSQGAHGMHSADVDDDGRDEIVLGSVVLDDDGTVLWSVGLGHPDKCFVTDVDPQRPGMEIFYAIEVWRDDGKGVCLVDARTGEMIWEIGQKTWHVGDGMVADIDPSLPGLECFATEDSKGGSVAKYMFSAEGERVGEMEDVPDCRNWVFWDADLLRETLAYNSRRRNVARKMSIMKYKGDTLETGLEGRIIMMADILGDWREEVIMVQDGELKVYTTTIPAADRRVCLMQDPVYRLEVAHRSMGYEQSPVPGYYLGIDPSQAGEWNPVIPRK